MAGPLALHRWFALLLGAVLGGCLVDVDFSGTRYRCSSTPQCPPGYECIAGWCEPEVTVATTRTLTIAAAQLDSSCSTLLTDFPLLVSIENDDGLRTVQSGGHVLYDDGRDILFHDSHGITRLEHEIEAYDGTTGTLIAWVHLPALSPFEDTLLHMCYGDPRTVSAEDPGAVWSNEFVGVWHLRESAEGTGTADLYRDSTRNQNHGADQVSANGQGGKIGAGQKFDGNDDAIDCGADSSLDVNEVTIELWVRLDSWVENGGLVSKGGNETRAYWMWTFDSAGSVEIDQAGTTNYALTFSLHTWHHLAVTYDGTEVKTFTDGVLENTYAQATGDIGATPEPLVLGAPPSLAALDGSLDEVRISDVAHSPCWIAASYDNQSDPSVFVSTGVQRDCSGCGP